MSREPCESCGKYFLIDDLVPTGYDDDGLAVFTTYTCPGCIHSADVDNYWQDRSDSEDDDSRRGDTSDLDDEDGDR